LRGYDSSHSPYRAEKDGAHKLLRKEHDKAIAAAQEAIAINPNAADAYAQLGSVLTYSGRAEEGLKFIEKAMRLNPVPPPHYLLWLGHTYRLLAQYRKAIEVYEKILERYPDNLWAHIWLTATYSTSGREEEARQQAEELIRLDPTFSLEQWAENTPIKDRVEVERFVADLRKAGLK
jgi:adenylate cyclase